jgi:hypothetical protein
MVLARDNYLYQKFSGDPFMRTTALDQAKLTTPVIYSQSVTDFRVSIFNLMTTFVQNDIYFEQLSFGISLANTLIFILIALRLFWKLRQIELYAL